MTRTTHTQGDTRRRRRDRSIFSAAKLSEDIITAPPMHVVTAGRVSRFNELARRQEIAEF
jgi:hypothetical protein